MNYCQPTAYPGKTWNIGNCHGALAATQIWHDIRRTEDTSTAFSELKIDN
ncbi:hypothetical protein ACSQ6I_27825 [Anabaena sp. WFMT]